MLHHTSPNQLHNVCDPHFEILLVPNQDQKSISQTNRPHIFLVMYGLMWLRVAQSSVCNANITARIFLIILLWRWPRKWSKYVGGYFVIKLHQNIKVHLSAGCCKTAQYEKVTRSIGVRNYWRGKQRRSGTAKGQKNYCKEKNVTWYTSDGTQSLLLVILSTTIL